MTCRIRCEHASPPPRPVRCTRCGDGPLDVIYSSTATGLHLCGECFAQMVERGSARPADPGSL